MNMNNNANAWLRYKNAPNAVLKRLSTANLEKMVNNSYMSSNRTGLANWHLKVHKIIANRSLNQKWRRAHPITSRAKNATRQAAEIATAIHGGLHIGYKPKNNKPLVISSVHEAKRRQNIENRRKTQNKVKQMISNLFHKEFTHKGYNLPMRYKSFLRNWSRAGNNLNKRNKVIIGFNRSHGALFGNLPLREKMRSIGYIIPMLALTGGR